MKKILNKKVVIIFVIILIVIATIFAIISNRMKVVEKVSDNPEQLTTDENAYITMKEHLAEIQNSGIKYESTDEVFFIKALAARQKTGNGNQDFEGNFTPDRDCKAIFAVTIGSGSYTLGTMRAMEITDPGGNTYNPIIAKPMQTPNDNNFPITVNAIPGASFYQGYFKANTKYIMKMRLNLTTGSSSYIGYGQVYVYGVAESAT